MKVPKHYLYFLSAMLWTIPSFMLYRKGLEQIVGTQHMWLKIAIGIAVGSLFFILSFRKISARYIERINNLVGHKQPFYQFMPMRTYVIMLFMISLGFSIRYFNIVPISYYSIFLLTMATPLLISAVRFALQGFMNKSK